MGMFLKGSVTCTRDSESEKQLKDILYVGRFDYQVEYLRNKAVHIIFSKDFRTIENEDLLKILMNFNKETRLK